MDDVFERMNAFRRAVGKFQECLEDSLADLQRCHQAVDPLWQDEARRDYDLHYDPLHEMLMRYAQVQGPAYLQFLDDKLRAIEAYLYG